MPAERVTMRRVREILRYRFEEGLGHKAISLPGGCGALDGARDVEAFRGRRAGLALAGR